MKVIETDYDRKAKQFVIRYMAINTKIPVRKMLAISKPIIKAAH